MILNFPVPQRAKLSDQLFVKSIDEGLGGQVALLRIKLPKSFDHKATSTKQNNSWLYRN
jgi:hypothetical protein